MNTVEQIKQYDFYSKVYILIGNGSKKFHLVLDKFSFFKNLVFHKNYS